jgi:pimeloyl-ACP methyl ester carboxylesterase
MTQTFTTADGNSMAIFESGEGSLDVIWAHGWGQTHEAFAPVAAGLGGDVRHYLLDFPGFGASPRPNVPWSTVEYGDFAAQWLASLPKKPRLWIGHSFGCRVGVRVASRHPGLLDGMILIAGAGIRPPVPFARRITRYWRGRAFATLKFLARSEEARNNLRARWGSADYRNAGPLRETFVRVINEDLTGPAKTIQIPVRLIYGERDTETTVSVGRKFEAALPHGSLTVLPRFGHLDILTAGRFQLQPIIQDVIRDMRR